MKFWMLLATPLVLSLGVTTAHAQGFNMSGNWGTGMYGGMQGCGMDYGAADGAQDKIDELREEYDAIKKSEEKLKELTKNKKTADNAVKAAKDKIDRVLSSEFTDVIYSHMDNSFSCSDYKGIGAEGTSTGADEAGKKVTKGATQEINAFQIAEWAKFCDKDGYLRGGVCDDATYRNPQKGSGTATAVSCKAGLVDYRKNIKQSQKLQTEIENLKESIQVAKDDFKQRKKDVASEIREEEKERRREQSEAGLCVNCMLKRSGYNYEKRETDWGSVVGNVGLGLAAVYAGQQMNRTVVDANASIGYPSNPYPAWGYGFPFIAQGVAQAIGGGSGIYGAIGGGIGAGSFGCAGQNGGALGMMGPYAGMNGQGMWGNPYAMMGMMNGMGPFQNGMGPWGMNGMFGMPNLNMMGMGNMMTGAPMMGNMMGMGNMMMGAPMMGNMMGMGNMMMGAPMMGNMMGMGNMMTGAPMMGNMMGMGNMMTGAPMMGNMMGMGNMMMGAPMMGNMMGMGNMMNGGLGSMEMQQQMMQMQMQQYQMYVQQQQSMMQQQMQRQQAVASLQQELYGLVYRIQQVQYGAGGSFGGSLGINGSYIGGGYNSGYNTGYGNGVITPLPGSVGGGGVTPINGGTGYSTSPR